MLRVTFILILTTLGVTLSFKDAFFGLLLYTWYTYVSPLDLTYGVLANSRLSFLVAAVLIITGIFQTKLLFRKSILTFVAMTFCGVAFISLAVHGTYNISSILQQTSDLNKLIFIALFSPVLVNSVARLKIYILTIVISVGFLAAYYGIFGLLSGSTYIAGAGRIGDNNFYALLLSASLPLVLLSIKSFKGIIIKLTLGVTFIGMLTAIVLTYSRGGFIATIVVLSLWFLSRQRKFLLPIIILLVSTFVVFNHYGLIRSFDEFAFEREFRSNDTISETLDGYVLRIQTLFNQPEELESGRSRLHFWKVAVLMANDRPFWGVGLNHYSASYSAYDFSGGEFGDLRAVHSTPMLVLAELGYLGFACFSGLIIISIFSLCKIKRKFKLNNLPESQFMIDCCNSIIICFIGFIIAGSLVVGLYNEIFWSLITLTIICQHLTKILHDENTSNNSLHTIPA